jgi:phenylacetate-CoA ligase
MTRDPFATPEPPEILRRWFGGAATPPLEHWPPEQLRAYQTEAITEQLSRVETHNAFYREKFSRAGIRAADFRTLEDLGRFPLTAKDELRGDPWVLLSVPRSKVLLAHTSTGTTGGAWSYLLYTWEDMYLRDFTLRPRLLMPVGEGDVVLNALPYEISSSGQSFQRSLQGGGALVIPAGKGGFYSDPYKTVRIMADLGATVLITTPPYALLLAEVAGRLGLRTGADLRLRFMWLTGEGCAPAYRRRLEQRWQCQGLVFYGSLECGSVGIECPEQAGSHVCAGHVYLEVLDPATGWPQPPGQVGEVVCTVLQRTASPLIRFRTQDLGVVDSTPCACGARLPRLHLRGRMADQVRAPGEIPISPYAIEEVLFAQPEMGDNYQVYVEGDRFRIEAEAGPGDAEAARVRIVEVLRQRGLQADLAWVEHIPRVGGKTRRVRPLADREQVMMAPCLLDQP